MLKRLVSSKIDPVGFSILGIKYLHTLLARFKRYMFNILFGESGGFSSDPVLDTL